MLDIGFPRHWSTLKKLAWLRGSPISGSPTYETVEGAIASFETLRAAPLQSLLVNINPVQAGSGEPNPSNPRPITGTTGSITVNQSAYNMIDQDYLLQASGWAKSTDPGFTTYGVHNAQVYKGTIRNLYNKYPSTSSYIPIANAKPGLSYVVGYRWRSVSANSNYGLKMSVVYSDGTESGLTSSQAANQTWAGRYVQTPVNKTPVGVRFDYNNNFEIYLTSLMCIESTLFFSQPDTPEDRSFANDLSSVTVTIPSDPGTVYGGTLDVVSGILLVDWLSITLSSSTDYTISSSGYSDATQSYWVYIRIKTPTPIINNTPDEGDGNGLMSVGGWRKGVGAGGPRAFATNQDATRPVGVVFNDLSASPTKAIVDAFLDDAISNNRAYQVCYKIKNPQSYQLTPQEISTIKGQNDIWADTGDVTVTYRSN